MARVPCSKRLAVVIALIPLFVLPGANSAAADEPCVAVTALDCSTSGANTVADTVHGWLLAPDQGHAARESSQRHGCGDCVWTVTTRCVLDSGFSGPDGDHCAGTYVGCQLTELRYLVYLTTPETGTQLVSQYCRGDGTGVVTQASVLPDIRSYLDRLSVARPTISSWPADATALVNIPTYFAAAPAQAGDLAFGGAGFTMNLGVTPGTYEWSFGDGQALSTQEPGAAPPGGTVKHTYRTAGPASVGLTVTYDATYEVQTPFGAIGPLVVPGGPVQSAPAQLTLDVGESLATLTR
jgi:hypothetical protein